MLGAVWLCLFRYCQLNSYNDHSSFFYRRKDAFVPSYSRVREREADDYLSGLESKATPYNTRLGGGSRVDTHESDDTAPFCMGIPTLRRDKEQFLPRTLASLVDNLDKKEREQLGIITLISDEKATRNKAFGKPWLSALADKVLVHEGIEASLIEKNGYSTVPKTGVIKPMNEHVKRDYENLVRICRYRDADYFILVEDDVIASRDWFPRMRAALKEIEDSGDQNWLYLRLFYSETIHGWNSEEWPIYIRYILAVYVSVAGLIFVTHCFLRRKPMMRNPNTSRTLRLIAASILVVWMPVFTTLYFMAGRLLVNPYRPGVREMPNYGCCSQGLVVPARHLPLLEEGLANGPFDMPADSTIEKIAADSGLKKLAIVPSVMQHVGIRGSSFGGKQKVKNWNFSFERFTK